MDYGVGNLRSVKKGLEKAGATVSITLDFKALQVSDAIVLPGVGAFNAAIKHLKNLHHLFIESINSQKFILGICLGLQLLFTKSCEGGQTYGLNLIKGEIIRLPDTVKLPQMGWNTIKIKQDHPFLKGIDDNSYVYFANSYIPCPLDLDVIISTTEYGTIFPSIIAKQNLLATQFHPEKSGIVGQKLLRNFIQLLRR